VDVAKDADFKVAKGHPGEHSRLLPFNFVHDVPEKGEAIGEVARAKDLIEQAELQNNIG
jgi:hypothetical protein